MPPHVGGPALVDASIEPDVSSIKTTYGLRTVSAVAVENTVVMATMASHRVNGGIGSPLSHAPGDLHGYLPVIGGRACPKRIARRRA
jgi:hypothetical protein